MHHPHHGTDEEVDRRRLDELPDDRSDRSRSRTARLALR